MSLETSTFKDLSNSKVEKVLLGLLLELDLVSAIRSETIMNGHYLGTLWFNQIDKNLEVLA